jgi:hypothetical protein
MGNPIMVAGKLSRMPVRSMPWIGLDWSDHRFNIIISSLMGQKKWSRPHAGMFMDHMHRLMQMLRLPLFEKKNAVITCKKCVSSATDVTRALVAMFCDIMEGIDGDSKHVEKKGSPLPKAASMIDWCAHSCLLVMI